jgi:hypothetical protein
MFNPKETPIVGYVTPTGEVRKALVNDVSPEGNPDLTVLEMVTNATHDEGRAPGTWHYLEGQEPAVVEEAPAVESEEPSEPA